MGVVSGAGVGEEESRRWRAPSPHALPAKPLAPTELVLRSPFFSLIERKHRSARLASPWDRDEIKSEYKIKIVKEHKQGTKRGERNRLGHDHLRRCFDGSSCTREQVEGQRAEGSGSDECDRTHLLLDHSGKDELPIVDLDTLILQLRF